MTFGGTHSVFWHFQQFCEVASFSSILFIPAFWKEYYWKQFIWMKLAKGFSLAHEWIQVAAYVAYIMYMRIWENKSRSENQQLQSYHSVSQTVSQFSCSFLESSCSQSPVPFHDAVLS